MGVKENEAKLLKGYVRASLCCICFRSLGCRLHQSIGVPTGARTINILGSSGTCNNVDYDYCITTTTAALRQEQELSDKVPCKEPEYFYYSPVVEFRANSSTSLGRSLRVLVLLW